MKIEQNCRAKPLESCYFYIDLEIPIIPCCSPKHEGMSHKHISECKNPGKVPIIPGWTKRTKTTASELDMWVKQWPYANPGLPLGSSSGLVGVDIDGETGEKILQKWSNGELPETWEFSTGAGRRLLYKLPEGVVLKKHAQADRTKAHEECALLGEGQQTVIPPGIHFTGRIYRWKAGHDPITFGSPAIAPQWMIERMTKNKIVTIAEVRSKRNNNQFPGDPKEILDKLCEKCQRFNKDWQQQQGRGIDEDTWFLWLSLLVSSGYPEAAELFSSASRKYDNRSYERLRKLIQRQEDDPLPPVRCTSFSCTVEAIKVCHRKIRSDRDNEITNSPAAFIMTRWQVARRYFSGKTFLPRRLGEHLLEDYHFLYISQLLYVFRNGVYINEGTDVVKTECKERLGDEFRKNRVEETEYYIQVSSQGCVDEIGKHPCLINCKNGLYDLKKNVLLPHNPKLISVTQINSNYNQNAKCPKFLSYLEEILPSETIVLLQEVTGYVIVPVTKAQKAFVIYGPGSSGKSTYLAVVEHLLGKNNVSNIAWQDLGDRFRTAELFGKLANIAADLPSKALEDTSVFKNIVGEDTVLAERKFQNPFSFKPFARLLFSCNKLPFSKDQSSGFYRRPIIIPFGRVVDEGKVDKELKQKLFEEVDGILQWALIGLRRLIKNNFKFSETEAMKELLNKYRIENSSVLSFIQDTCIVQPDNPLLETGRAELYSKYKEYCDGNGFRCSSQRNFNAEIETNYPGVLRTLSGPRRVKMWRGLELLENENIEEEIF